MPRTSKITEEMGRVILARSGILSHEDLARELGVSKSAIARFIARTRDERRAIAKPILEQHIADTLPADLQRLAEDIDRMDRIIQDAERNNFPHVAIKATAERRQLVALRAKLNGVSGAAEDFFIADIASLLGVALEEEDAAADAAAFATDNVQPKAHDVANEET